jgi:hypothetical protein
MKKILFLTLLVPHLVSAQTNLGSLLYAIDGLIYILIPIVFTLAVVYFFWGLADFIRKAGGSEVEEGKRKMIWGIIALFVMASIWGIVFFISDIFFIQTIV